MNMQISGETLYSFYKNRGTWGKSLIILSIVLFYLISVLVPIFSESIRHYMLVKTGQVKEVDVWQTTPTPKLIEETFGTYNETQKWNTEYYSFKMKNTHPLKTQKIKVDIDIYPGDYTIILPRKEVNIASEEEEEIVFKVDFAKQGEHSIVVIAEDSASGEIYDSEDWKAPIYN